MTTEIAMSLIDPLQLMTMMGATPERPARSTLSSGLGADRFQNQMHSALGNQQELAALSAGSSSPMENALMHTALNGLASLVQMHGNTGSSSRTSKAVATTSGNKHAAIGALSARFESGDQGVNAIGYDSAGGTSYGTYQIASKPGTMKSFIDYLKTEEPQWAAKLQSAGPANTGSRKGRMPDAWRSIATENPERFGQLQRDFIERTHYEPARDKILTRTGVDIDTMPQAAQEALWSTSVQHGSAGAARIFDKIISSIKDTPGSTAFAQKLIDKVYDDRKGKFTSSTAAVQASVQGRMNTEKNMVLAMLNQETSTA
ncbi:MAG: hypothetical protein GX055_04645 [Desulfovibrionales bacterium]|nr:hypothetical protein [Desulfovibrionales bacterium]